MLTVSIFPCMWTAGLTLALFGGVQKYVHDQNKVPVRGDVHVLIVGKVLFSSYVQMVP
jgi:hypothetical protein